MRENKIALLIDVDNVKIGSKAFEELFDELKERGEVVYCKFYGYNDRKHIYLSDLISKYGYETAPFMRFKKRFSQLDNRIFVDAVKLNYTKPEINTYCIVAGDGDLIPLLVELKSSGRHLIDINTEFQELNAHMFDEHIVVPSIEMLPKCTLPKCPKLHQSQKQNQHQNLWLRKKNQPQLQNQHQRLNLLLNQNQLLWKKKWKKWTMKLIPNYRQP